MSLTKFTAFPWITVRMKMVHRFMTYGVTGYEFKAVLIFGGACIRLSCGDASVLSKDDNLMVSYGMRYRLACIRNIVPVVFNL